MGIRRSAAGKITRLHVRSLVGGALVLAVGIAFTTPGQVRAEPSEVDFRRDVKPILEEHCFECHGPSKREGGLRLSNRRDAFVAGDLGVPAIVPSSADFSPLYELIISTDPEERMPQESDPLDPTEIETLRQWIDSGAVWPDGADAEPTHWAYRPPSRPPLPSGGEATENAIDAFLLAEIERAELTPTGEADRETLIRRVTLDLTGLPPTLEEVDAFVGDESPDAYEALVDRLLARPTFGEHWASQWLDLVRYADSVGFQSDQLSSNWPYRDWVIGAINDDMPFDRFTVEQLAGDLLPDASWDQKVATGLHRAAPLNIEGGVHAEESRVQQVMDRVNVTSTIWLGSTMECAQCHNHKYDGFTQEEYYRLFAFFNNTPIETYETGAASLGLTGPRVTLPDTPEVERERRELLAGLSKMVREQRGLDETTHTKRSAWRGVFLSAEEKGQKQLHLAHSSASFLLGFVASDESSPEEFEAWRKEMRAAVEAGEPQWQPLEVLSFESTGGEDHSVLDDQSVLVSGPVPDTTTYHVRARTDLSGITTIRLEVEPHESLPGGGPGRGDEAQPDFVLTEFEIEREDGSPDDLSKLLLYAPRASRQSHDAVVAGAIDGDPSTGWTTPQPYGTVEWASVGLEDTLGRPGESTTLRFTLVQNAGFGRTIGRLRFAATTAPRVIASMPKKLRSYLVKDKPRPPLETALLAYHDALQVPADATRHLRRVGRRLPELGQVSAAILEEAEPRETRLLKRGDYLNPAAEVAPGTPAILHPMPDDLPRNRLGLARWLVDSANPLVARVTVNRWWAALFGRGLVATPEDFGSQGDRPTHPELLDWLALEFVDGGWSRKGIVRKIVTSAAYRRGSRPEDDQTVERDPDNRLLARSERLRLPAESVRDNALAISGLLSSKMGGPAVYPPQPADVWRLTGSNQPRYELSTEEDQYRRGVYTIWRRSSPYPSFVNFDAPDRTSCVVIRDRTNTPLQALTLWNDEVYVEAALGLASRILTERPDAELDARLRHGFRLATTRSPTDAEVDVLAQLYEWHRSKVADDPDMASAILGSFSPPPGVEPTDAAAWFLVASALLNLDETITRG